jgi:hypothetical protein
MLSLVAAAVLAAAPDSSLVYAGRAGRVDVAIPRVEASVEVDGRLDEPAWAQAAVLTGFSGYLPVDGQPAEDSTEVRVWYSPTALHVGIRAWEPHGPPRATLADRDRLDGEDHVQLLLDTFDDRQRAYVLAVNALGVQADGVRAETGTAFQPRMGLGNVDLSPDVVFDSRGRVTEWGYEVEVRIPFRSLRYGRGLTRWGLNVIRQVQHSGRQDTWAPVARSETSFLGQAGRLDGLAGIRRGVSLDVNPVLTSTAAGSPDDEGRWGYEGEAELGGNVRWGITPDLTLNATYRPDFSQVESDAGQVPGDNRFALFFPEKRPFFVEGIEQFQVPNQLIYTRRIVEPTAAAKLSGKVAGTEVAFLSAVDDRRLSLTGSRPLYNILRLRRNIGGQSLVGFAYTDRTDGDAFNRVASVDARLVRGPWQVAMQGAGSATRRDGETELAPLWDASVSWNTRKYGVRYQVQGIHPDFAAQAGFLSRGNDFARINLNHRVSSYGAADDRLQSWRGRLIFDGLWGYDELFDGSTPLETKLWAENTFVLRGGWNIMAMPLWETFAFDPAAYAHYAVAAGGDTTAFEVNPRQYTGGLYWTLDSPRFSTVSFSAQGYLGLDPDFYETATAFRRDLIGSVAWRPTPKLRTEASFAHSDFARRRDGSIVSSLDIPRLKVEYQIARPLFVRVVGEYAAELRDALRDPRTDAPILFRAADGTLEPTVREERNELRVDWLLSYQPSPGTVLFAGYGSSMNEVDKLAFRGLERSRDGFFLKLSYVFRT